MGTSPVIQLAKADAIDWCEMAVLEIEPETSDPKASQPIATLCRSDAQSSTA